jgi:hypothetical protein
MHPTLDVFDVVAGAGGIWRALRLEAAAKARGQITISVEAVLAVCTHRGFGQNFTRRTGIMIGLGIVDKVIPAEEPPVRVV